MELAGLRNDRPPPCRKRVLSPCNWYLVEPLCMICRSKQQRACLLAAPGFEAALKRCGYAPGYSACSLVRSSPPFRHGSALNHSCSCGVA